MKDKLYYYRAKVTNIVDGDTFDAKLALGFYAELTLRFRMNRINAPEKRGSTRIEGQIAEAALANEILGRNVYIRTHKADSFGRWLADVYLVEQDDCVDINQYMLDYGFAKPYEG